MLLGRCIWIRKWPDPDLSNLEQVVKAKYSSVAKRNQIIQDSNLEHEKWPDPDLNNVEQVVKAK